MEIGANISVTINTTAVCEVKTKIQSDKCDCRRRVFTSLHRRGWGQETTYSLHFGSVCWQAVTAAATQEKFVKVCVFYLQGCSD